MYEDEDLPLFARIEPVPERIEDNPSVQIVLHRDGIYEVSYIPRFKDFTSTDESSRVFYPYFSIGAATDAAERLKRY